MPNPIKYSASTQTLALKKGNYWIGTGDVAKGPTPTTDYWNGITPPSGGYTIYLNKASGGPSIYCPANDSQLISLTNGIAGQTFATAAAALDWFATQTDKMVFNVDYEAVVTDGLVLAVDAGFTPSYPTTGSTWYDISGSNCNGTLTNGPSFNSSNNGSIVFDGIDDYVSVNTSIGNSIATTSTISFWVYRSTTWNTSNTAVGQFLFTSYTDNSNRGLVYFSSDSGYVGTIGSLIVDGGTLTGRVYTQQNSWGIGWYNIVAVRGSSNYKIYVNGTDMALTTVSNTATRAFPSNPTYTLLGSAYFSTLNVYGYLTGRIANTLFYNRVLTAAEVTQNYNAQKGRFGL